MIGCQQRDIIERIFGWPKENRRLGTRYEKLPRTLPQRSPWLVRSDVYASIFVQNLGNSYSITADRFKSGPSHTCAFKAELYLLADY